MKPKYVIQSQIDNTYWNFNQRGFFRSISFASMFDNIPDAEAHIETMPRFAPTQVLTILPIYQK